MEELESFSYIILPCQSIILESSDLQLQKIGGGQRKLKG